MQMYLANATLKKRIVGIVGVILAVVMVFSPVSAKGAGQFSVTWSIASLVAKGDVWGIGNTDVIMNLQGDAVPLVICTNQGGNAAPGQNPAHATSIASSLVTPGALTKNGKTPYTTEAPNPTWDTSQYTAVQMGCANNNWTFQVVGLRWDAATLTLTDLSGNVLAQQSYSCTQSSDTTVSCTALK